MPTTSHTVPITKQTTIPITIRMQPETIFSHPHKKKFQSHAAHLRESSAVSEHDQRLQHNSQRINEHNLVPMIGTESISGMFCAQSKWQNRSLCGKLSSTIQHQHDIYFLGRFLDENCRCTSLCHREARTR